MSKNICERKKKPVLHNGKSAHGSIESVIRGHNMPSSNYYSLLLIDANNVLSGMSNYQRYISNSKNLYDREELDASEFFFNGVDG